MIRVCSYNPNENNGEPKIHATVSGSTRWRIDIRAKQPGQIEQRLIVRVEDPLPLAEVHQQAVASLCELLPEGVPCESAGFDLWADA